MMSLRLPMAGMPTSTLTALLFALSPLAVSAQPENHSGHYPEHHAEHHPEQAQQQNPVQFLLGAGLTFGGDKLADVEVEYYGDDSSTEDVTAGGLTHLYGGVNVNIPDTDFSIQTTIGWHSDGIFAQNGSVSFTRYPFEITPYYNFKKVRIGLGLSYHINPELSGDDDANIGDREYDDALGLIASIEFKAGKHFAVGVRHTRIEYELSSIQYHWRERHIDTTEEVDGSNTGIYGTFLF